MKENLESAFKDALIASEARYRRLFESAKDGILILEAESGKIMDVNPFLVGLLGYPKEKFIDKELWEIGFFKDIAANKDKFLELQKNKYVRYEDLPLETTSGQKINVEFVSNVYMENKKRVIQCNIRDITKRKRAEIDLIVSENRLKSLIQTIPDLIWLKDMDGKYLSCNTMFGRFFGASETDIVGKTDYNFVNRELADFFRENDQKSIVAGEPTRNEEWITFADDGHRVYLETIKAPMYDSKNKLIGVIGIGRDITERKQAEKDLIEAKENAVESDHLKSAFLANMSHEIRTPLNGIIGFSELLADSYFSEEQKKKFIQHIVNNGNSLLSIISDIMDISKLESGECKIHKSKINAQEFISNIKEQFTILVEGKKLELKLSLPKNGEETTIFADADRLKQIFNNLISNAMKFTKTGFIEIGYNLGNTRLYTNSEPVELEFFVKDTGIGIAAEHHDKIFQRFRQVETSNTRKFGGNGLGLSISKNLVELMGGKIWFKSDPDNHREDKGSTFYFTVPIYSKTVR